MRKIATAAVLLAALTLAGCSAAATTSDTSSAADGDASTSRVIAAPEPTRPSDPAFDGVDLDQYFLDGIKPAWRGDLPSDESLISSGQTACDELRAGKTMRETVVVTDGAEAEWNNRQLVVTGASAYCREFVDVG